MIKKEFIKNTAYDTLIKLPTLNKEYITKNLDKVDELMPYLHLTLGTEIRNTYIYGENVELDDVDEIVADDLSEEIIKYVVYLLKAKKLYESKDQNNISFSCDEERDYFYAYDDYLYARNEIVKEDELSLYKDAKRFCEYIDNEDPIGAEDCQWLYKLLTRINYEICFMPEADNYESLADDDTFNDFPIDIPNISFQCRDSNHVVSRLSNIYEALAEYIIYFNSENYDGALAILQKNYKKDIRLKVDILATLRSLCSYEIYCLNKEDDMDI